MYIEPQTNIKILHNVPLDTSYEHTIYFSSAETQRGYFAYMQKYNLSNYTYQRVQRGMARVGIKADDLYDCNYMMFQNSAYGDKWFYAFITNVEFINNETSQITFEIDVMQTWHFNYNPDYCFVEREHSATDNIGDNIIPEAVETGEYVFDGYTNLVDLSDLTVIIAVVDVNDISGATHGVLYDGIYGSAELYGYSSTDINGINGKITEYLQKPDAIIGMYVCPTAFITAISDDKIVATGQAKSWSISASAVNTSMSLDGYVPKNHKLYTYPFNFYHVDNGSGSGLSLRYEFFSNLTPTFTVSGMVTQPVKGVLRPTAYKGANTSMTENLTLTNFPMCSWSVDAYQAWVAQNSIPMTIDAISGLVQTGVSAIGATSDAGVGTHLISQGIGMVSNVLKQSYKASIASDITKGCSNNGGINVADKKQHFYGGRCCITHQYAQMIDDYFTRFGYATNRLKIPNRNLRPHWNYVKTIGCTLTGSIPADDMRKICSIYDNGITFWRNGSEVGDYTLNNSPV